MARCWTCGLSVSDNHYRCSACEDSLREIESLHDTVSEGFADLARIQEAGFNQLSDQFSEIATILEWGFGELSWRLQQQTKVLQNINHTLKTPSETKANEWRLHAEELRRRGVLEESEEFFLKALNEHRLDYRIYVGLAETYLQMNRFDKAKVFLEKSLPHAPKEEIDYKSYSYRLIGRIYACEEDYVKALDSLHLSIKLSPNYTDGLYDFAQYVSLVSDDVAGRICSQILRGEWDGKDYNFLCLVALQKVIDAKPAYFYLAQKEKNFDRRKSTVHLTLKNLLDDACGRVENSIAKINTILEEVDRAISEARNSVNRFRDVELECSRIYDDAKSRLKLAKDKLTSGDYLKVLEAERIAKESLSLFEKSKEKARSEKDSHEYRFKAIVRESFDFGEIVGISAGLAFLLGIGGCTITAIFSSKWVSGDLGPAIEAFFSTGFIGFFIVMIGVLYYRFFKLYIEKPTTKHEDED